MGVKHLYDLVPRALTQRLKKERRKAWDEKQAVTVAAVRNALANCNDLLDAAKAAAKAKGSEARVRPSKQEEECKTRIQLLKDMMEKYEDTGTPWAKSVCACTEFVVCEMQEAL